MITFNSMLNIYTYINYESEKTKRYLQPKKKHVVKQQRANEQER